MKAVQYAEFGGPEVLRFVDLPAPEPGPSQVRIAVHAVGVNPIDWKLRSGAMGGDLPRGTGVEAAGIVDSVGAEVEGIAVGDRAFGSAANAAAQNALLGQFARLPASVQFTEAAALPVAVETATRCLNLLDVSAGQTLLINGASGAVGLATVQLARGRGLRVIGSGGPHSQDRLREFGAEPVVYGDGIVEQVRALAPTGSTARSTWRSAAGSMRSCSSPAAPTTCSRSPTSPAPSGPACASAAAAANAPGRRCTRSPR